MDNQFNNLLEKAQMEMDEIGGYRLKDFDSILNQCHEYIDNLSHKELATLDYSSVRMLKDSRTEIRKTKELSKNLRLQFNALLLSVIDRQFKQLEKMLDEADKELKTRVDTYQADMGKVNQKPKVITLTVKGYDMKAIKNIQDLAISLGLEAIIKGE